MKLITENIIDSKYIVEEVDGKKNYFIEGTYLQGETVNGNGRLYPIEILDREVARYTKDKIEKHCAYGELGHPSTPTINLDRVSHMVKSFRKEGNNYWGRAKLVDTPMGNIAKSLIDEGASLGVSSRGLGSMTTHKNGYKVIGDDFKLAVAADIVASPSAPEAFVQGVFEGAEWVFNPTSGTWMEQRIESMQQFVKQNLLTEDRKLQLFRYFLDGIIRKDTKNNK